MVMSNRALFLVIVGVAANAGFAFSAGPQVPVLSLDAAPSDAPATTAAPAAPQAPLMMGLEKLGLGKPLEDAGLNIYGWIDAGYTYDHRSHGHNGPVILGVATYGTRGQQNHAYLNQFALRFERTVASDKWDVGGLIEVMYGSDTAAIHSNGMSFGNETRSGRGGTPGADDRFNPLYQFDITQAYIDVSVPVGNGLIIRAGKFYGLLGYESNVGRSTPFYSRSSLFNATPYTHTGI